MQATYMQYYRLEHPRQINSALALTLMEIISTWVCGIDDDACNGTAVAIMSTHHALRFARYPPSINAFQYESSTSILDIPAGCDALPDVLRSIAKPPYWPAPPVPSMPPPVRESRVPSTLEPDGYAWDDSIACAGSWRPGPALGKGPVG